MTAPSHDLAEGRRLLAEGRHAIALEHFVQVADAAASEEDKAAAIAHAAEINLALHRPYEAMAWTQRLRAETGNHEQADLLEAVAQLRTGATDAALALLSSVGEAATESGGYRPSVVDVVRAQVLASLQRHDEAVAALVRAMAADPEDPDVWTTLAAQCAATAIDPSPVLDAVPDDAPVAETYGHLLEASPSGADRVLEALWRRSPGDARALALVAYLGHRLSVERALEWSSRLRAAGRSDDCALLGLAASKDRAALDRVRAAAVAWSAFGDTRARALLDLAVGALPDGDLEAALGQVGVLAPDLAGVFLVAAATTPSRALVLARSVAQHDATDVAVALLKEAVTLAGGHVTALRGAVAQSLSADDVAHLAGVAAGAGAADVAGALRAAA